MIKKTLYFGNQAFLNAKNNQLIINKKDEKTSEKKEILIPIEDIGVVIIDNYGVTLTQYLLSSLIENNVAVVICNSNHLPNGMFLNLDCNTLQSEKFRNQISASKPLLKNLWQQIVIAKIKNKTSLLKKNNIPVSNMKKWISEVKSNDSTNLEARASVYYWKNLFPKDINFERDRYGEPPNNLLNYGYAILRAVVARGLVASGILPTIGIHHHNKYNSYCLADDIMEPYRPFVDEIVLNIVKNNENFFDLNTEMKKKLLKIPVIDIFIDNEKRPLMIGLQRTTASLAKCYAGETKKIIFPELK